MKNIPKLFELWGWGKPNCTYLAPTSGLLHLTPGNSSPPGHRDAASPFASSSCRRSASFDLRRRRTSIPMDPKDPRGSIRQNGTGKRIDSGS